MRIVAVQTGLTPYSVLGGTVTDREFLTRLADCGIEVHVLAEAGEPIVEHRNFVHHFWQRRLRRRVPYAGNLDVAIDLRRLLQKLGPVDWIRFNSPYSVGIGAVMASRRKRVWGSYLHCEDRTMWKWIDRWLPQYCTLITCLSEDTRRDVLARCASLDPSRAVVIPMGIDTRRFQPSAEARRAVRQQLGIAEEQTLLLYAGSLIPRKGIAELVRTWGLLGPRSDVRLLVIGRSGPTAESRLIADLVARDPRVVHLEQVLHEHIAPYFQASDAFLFPTRLEGFGIVLGEAMACELPVVTTNAKGVSEVVLPDQTALVAEVGRADQLARHVNGIVADPALGRRLGMAGRRRVVSMYSWDRIMDRLLGVLGCA